jgi:tetratricopeptide (TPR) repeat protein
MPASTKNPLDEAPDHAIIRDCLSRVLTSEEFAGANRLQSLLEYLVEQKIAGHEDRLKGKNIAEDVYGRKLVNGPEGEPVVRVDASRLRRRLKQYYSATGQHDPINIDVPSGSYVPEFSVQDKHSDLSSQSAKPSKKYLILIAIGLAGLIGLSVIVALQYLQLNDLRQQEITPSAGGPNSRETKLALERRAMFAKSPASLKAYDLAKQAREGTFPPTDPVRRHAALELAKRAIDFDADYFGGYAIAAQILGFSVIVPGPGDKVAMLAEAKAMAKKAESLNPNSAWVQSAIAWVAYVAGDFDRAMDTSELAVAMDGQDPHVRDYRGMIALFNGDFDKAIKAVSTHMDGNKNLSRLVHRNVYAVANFHLGNVDETIHVINEITNHGGASGVLTSSYLAAAYSAAGNVEKARELATQIQQAWPNSRFEILMQSVFRHPEHAAEVIDHLRKAGGK